MPNWCLNKLTIEHEDRSKVIEFVLAYKEGKACDHYLPMPKNEDGTPFDNWYGWAINNWGTKWDIGSDNGEVHGLNPTIVGNQASMSFDSAWSPPIGLYEKLHNLGFSIEATYFEPGIGFCGLWENGEDECIEYSSHDMIPKRIWEEYNLEEFFDDEPVS
jgi:hypothetical protein